MAEAAARQEAGAARRDALRTQARRIRIARAKHEEAISRLKHRRRELFLEAGVKDEQEFRQRALECARAERAPPRARGDRPRNRGRAGGRSVPRRRFGSSLKARRPRRWKPAATSSASGWRPSSSNSASCWRNAAG